MVELRDISKNCRIYIDKEGRWFYEGKEIIHPKVLDAFYSSLEMDDKGRYRIVMEPEVCYVEVEDTPFVVVSISGDREHGYKMRLNNSQVYTLDPSLLWIEGDNMLYTKIDNGMKVRFSRSAYYGFCLEMEEDNSGDIVLCVEGKTYTILPCKQ